MPAREEVRCSPHDVEVAALSFITIRDRNYLLYIGYAFTFGLLMNTLNGMTTVSLARLVQ